MQANSAGGYALVNGLNMYYEIHGEGVPLVLIHGGGSTIETSFGKILPWLAKHYKVIAVELQAMVIQTTGVVGYLLNRMQMI